MLETALSLVIAATALLGSPGPAPLALSAVSATFGLRRGAPFLSGILAGLAVSLSLSAVGLTALISAAPVVSRIVASAGFLYILYIAWKVATSPVLPTQATSKAAAPGFRDGFIINCLNPKAIIAFAALFSTFRFDVAPTALGVVLQAALIYAVALFVDIAWFAFGGALKRLFAAAGWGRALRLVFALAMIGSVLWAFSSLMR